jgi:hypothetical protein
LKSSFFKIALLVLLSQGFSACYDGWDERVSSDAGPTTPTDPEATKPLYLVLFEPFVLSDTATSDSSCFGATGTEQFRKAEWAKRMTLIASALTGVADKFIYDAHSIGVSDCVSLSTVETAASDVNPLDVMTVGDDALDRPMVHLKAVFWDTDVGGNFTSVVKTPHWAAWRILRTRGRPAVSLHYFSMSNRATGHFTDWRSSIDSNLSKDATAIDTIDPTDAGKSSRDATAASDASALASWVVTKAIEVRP